MSGRRTTRGPARRSARRGPDIRRASAGMNRTRWLALLVMIGSALAIYGLSASAVFGYHRLDIVGANRTPESIVRSELSIDDGTNLFRLSTDGMAQRLRALPTVSGATIEIALPDTLQVRLMEREAVLVWQVGDRRFLVDANGVAFADAAGTTGLPLVDDRRVRGAPRSPEPSGGSGELPAASGSPAKGPTAPAASGKAPLPSATAPQASPATPAASGDQPGATGAVPSPSASPEPLPGLVIGDTIDPVDFDAATRLGSLHPADVGSGGVGLNVRIDDEHGFSIDTGKDGWAAVFGFYTPTIRRTDLIPGQVRLLKSLLAGHEETIATVILAGEREGTYTVKASP